MTDDARVESELLQIREAGMMDCAGTRCTYCRHEKGDCRPVAVRDRDFIPALCNDCYTTLREHCRLDLERDREVFFP